ncbi:MAG: YdcF family protein [Actinomycetota bacterium]|nr:YdcF family protein [Actinomycetota bacterium]
MRLKWVVRALLAVVAVVFVYLGVTFIQVWQASRQDQARPVQAIVVLGAAQYNGVPSPDLKARLDHAYTLWTRHLADVVVVTGGKQPGDRFTEATASADYLAGLGIPQVAILREVGGRNSWQSLASSASFLKQRRLVTVLLVSDPFHDKRIALMADELGLKPYVSPTRTSPLGTGAEVVNYAKETGEVAVGRIIGFRRLVDLGDRVWG